MTEQNIAPVPAETADQLFGQGNALFGQGNREGAAHCYRRALRIEPSFAAASFNLGCAMEALAGPAQALPHFQLAATLRPNWCEAHSNLGFALARVGRMAEAAAELERAAALKPEDAGIRNNLGLALSALGQGAEAHASFQEAIRLDPLYPEPRSNLAILFERYGRASEAIACCLEALRLRPDYPEAHHNLATALKSQGRHLEAVAHFREALRLRPDYDEARSSLLFSLCYPAWLPEEELLAEHLEFGARQEFSAAGFGNDPAPDRPLRIGYVSADFRDHAVARFIEPVLRNHDRSRFRIFCYSNVSVPDARSAEIETVVDRFVNIAGVPDPEACAMIREDGIDILIDLSGHSAGNRLTLFARKPAPIQVTWLGYPHSTGLRAIDYRITDAVADPPGATERHHVEELLRLPGNFSCFAAPEQAPQVGELPCLSLGAITFGSFNNPAKITPETIALWADVLHRVPDSRLLIKGYSLSDPGSRARLSTLFAAQGIAPERLELLANTPGYREHLQLYGRVDIALDTFPYNGTTTSCEALWMGVPVVTLAGNSHRSRVGASLLGALGLQGLVARDARGFAEAAFALARDGARLKKLRETLRDTMSVSPLCDAARFTGHLESALRGVWQRWCAGRRPAAVADLESKGRELLQQGKLDQALGCFLALLRSERCTAALGPIQETLNRQMALDLARALGRDAVRLGALPAGSAEPATGPEAAADSTDQESILDGTLEETAQLLFAAGLVTPAELICRYLLDRGRRSRQVCRILGELALSLGQAALAESEFRDAIALGDDSLATRIRLHKAQESVRLKPAESKAGRFLLIKAWGYGFWSDVNHLLGQLLLAEITGRTPVVHWGANSLFSDDPGGNAFENFFEPVSSFTLEALATGNRSYYPAKWNGANLARDGINQSEGPGSRFSSLHALERGEEVVVSDFHFSLHDLVPWIPPGHRLHGMTTEQIYLYLFERYLKVKPWITAKAEAFYRQKMAGRVHLALHVRGGDKGGEDPNLARLNALYHLEIERYLQHTPKAGLFLMTDDREILAGYRSRYPDRLVHTGATRTETAQGVHYQKHASRYRLAEEVMVDTLLALHCQGFIGNGLSNVSCAVAQMKAWAPGSLRLLGARLDRLRQFTLYRS